MAWKDLFKQKSEFVVTEADRDWVEESYENLIRAYGYPRKSAVIEISRTYFVKCFTEDNFSPENMLSDLCKLLNLNPEQFKVVTVKDIRDSDLDYSSEGRMFEAELVLGKKNHIIHVAQEYVERPKRLVYLLAKQLIVFILIERFSNYNPQDDESLLAYIGAIWFGFGNLFANNLVDVGFERDGYKNHSWTNYSIMPIPVFGYALAYMDRLVDNIGYELKGEVGVAYEQAMFFLKDKVIKLYDSKELESDTLSAKSYDEYEAKEYEEALVLAQKALFLTQDQFKKSDLNVSIGYYHLMLERYEKAIPYFEKAIELNEYNAYAYDNSGYCYIQLGELEKGKNFVDKAIATEGNDDGYSFRNLAVYFWKIGDRRKAEEYFTMAMEWDGLEVDLLDELYEEFKKEV